MLIEYQEYIIMLMFHFRCGYSAVVGKLVSHHATNGCRPDRRAFLSISCGNFPCGVLRESSVIIIMTLDTPPPKT